MVQDSRVTAVLFDWDGVLLDSIGAAFNVYNKIFSRIGQRVLTKDEYLELQSPNWYEFYSKVGLPDALWNEVDGEWLRLYEEEKPKLHEDAVKCLAALKGAGLELALVSNGSRVRVENELARFGLKPRFDAIVYGERKEELKPSPVMLERALRLMRVEPQRAIYVGDSPADIQAAKNANVRSVAIARGPIQANRLRKERPDCIFGGLRDMADFVLARFDA